MSTANILNALMAPSQYKRLRTRLAESEEMARFTKGFEHSYLGCFIPGFALRKGCDIFPLLDLNRVSQLKFCVGQGRYTRFSRGETSFEMRNTGQMSLSCHGFDVQQAQLMPRLFSSVNR
jgi:hypothetical protein